MARAMRGLVALVVCGILVGSGLPGLPAVLAEDAEGPDEPDSWVEMNSWEGQLCGMRSSLMWMTRTGCLEQDGEFEHQFRVEKSLKTVTVRMEWDPVELGTTERLELRFWHSIDKESPYPFVSTASTHTYERVSATSPIEFRVDAGDLGNEHDFDEIQGEWTLRFSVRVAEGEGATWPYWEHGPVGLMVDQEFTVHYDLHYIEPAPPGPPMEPLVETNRWESQLPCSVKTPNTWAICGSDGTDHQHWFRAVEGLKTVVVAMEWDPEEATENLAGDLQVRFSRLFPEDWPWQDLAAAHTYQRLEGPSPLELRVDAGDDHGEHDFANLELDWWFRIQVWPGGDMNLVLDQPFTVHYHLFYAEHAPADYSALPGGD